jgi:UDP-2,3-diacylglucosamine hydrolase
VIALGTPVTVLAEREGDTLLCSDLHVPVDGGAVLEQLRWICREAQARRARLVVMGDLFDSYVSPRQIEVGAWREVASVLRQVVVAGGEVVVLRGNRDFLLGPEFERASGALLLAGGALASIGDRRVLLLHGDELCVRDLPYQHAKRWLRHPMTRWIARRLPLRAALRIAESARRRSRKVIQSGDPARFLPPPGALEEALSVGADLLVFGHIHRPASGLCGSGGYRVLPAFDMSSAAILAAADRPPAFVQVSDSGLAILDEPPPLPAAEDSAEVPKTPDGRT